MTRYSFPTPKTDYAIDEGTANAYKITLNPASTSYEEGKIYKFKAANANTGASTFQISGLGVTPIKKNVSVALAVGDIIANQIVTIIFDGTNFQLQEVKKRINFGTAAPSGGINGDIYLQYE